MKTSHRWVIAALMVPTVLALSRPILASSAAPEPGAVASHGVCSAESTWELTMNRDIGVEMETHLETGVPDEGWKLQMWYQGQLFFKEIVQSEGDGGFEVRRQERNLPGVDRFQFKATNTVTGEVCTAGIQFAF
jgi:hypothetical protein